LVIKIWGRAYPQTGLAQKANRQLAASAFPEGEAIARRFQAGLTTIGNFSHPHPTGQTGGGIRVFSAELPRK